MRVLVVGGTGYVGPAVVKELLLEGHDVVVLEHRRPCPVPDDAKLTRARGDALDPASLARAAEGCEAVVHLIAIIREDKARSVTFERMHVEAFRNVVHAAKAEGARRLVLMSANGCDARSTPYYDTKWRMEQVAKESGLAWTIFRPSFVSGVGEDGASGHRSSRGSDASAGRVLRAASAPRPSRGDARGFDETFADIVDKFPVLPAFSGGRFEIQPISRRNTAQALARCLARPQTEGKTYVLVGPERYSWREYLRRLAALRGRTRIIAWAPTSLVQAAAKVAGKRFPATSDQLKMLVEGSVGDPAPAVRDLGLELDAWETAVAALRRAP